MKTKANIFLVEDDFNFGSVLKAYLEMNDFSVSWVADGNDALKEFNSHEFDICLLDVMLPHIDGFKIAENIKKLNPEIPFVFITAKTLKEDVLKGYSKGADDYITKPFDSEVLICKIDAILSRTVKEQSINTTLTIFSLGRYNFNLDLREIEIEGEMQKLSPKESELLHLLCKHKNNVLPRELALNSIWGEDSYFTTRSMDVYITKLRKYLKKDPSIEIINIHGNGYRLVVSE